MILLILVVDDEPDVELLQTLGAVGFQIGQFLDV